METYKVTVNKNGTIRWYNENGQLHRIDGPACEYKNGEKEWYQNGKLHREDGPAVEYANGDKFWYQNDKLHRIDGPAVEYVDGRKEYWVKGKKYSKSKFDKLTKEDTCEGKIVEIDGKKYRLTVV